MTRGLALAFAITAVAAVGNLCWARPVFAETYVQDDTGWQLVAVHSSQKA